MPNKLTLMVAFDQNKKQVSIAEIIKNAPKKMHLKLLSGEQNLANNFINSDKIQKLGLAFAGYHKYINSGQIQMIGDSEISYLSQLDVKAKTRAIEALELSNIHCVLVSNELKLPSRLLERLTNYGIPILQTPLGNSSAISSLTGYLQNVLAERVTLHGVLLRMYGLGILIFGNSGIGKSECALDLVRNGHSLISDDSVEIRKVGNYIIGNSPELTKGLLEIRGLGIINIKDLYGVTSIGDEAKINLCIELQNWDKEHKIDRLGLMVREQEILTQKIPKFILPVTLGRNIATLVETAVRVHLLNKEGKNAAQKLIEKHSKIVKGK